MFDILIKNATIIDGTGTPMFRSDVGIKEDRIVKIRELHDERGEIEIDAYGKIVCPGFIDVNNHSDTYWQIFLEPDLPSLLYQGITTIVGGNCGSSLAPLVDAKNIESIQKWIDLKNINVDWLSMKEFFCFMEGKQLAVNFSTLVGHATLRRGVLRDEDRNLVPREMNFLKESLAKSMKEGALGLSTGLIYTHARTASTQELVEFAKVVKKYDGVYTTHLRDEKDRLLEGIEEAVTIARESGVKLHISHLKAIGEKNWLKIEEALAMIEAVRKTGVDVTFDVYPYVNTGSVLYAMLPAWISEGGKRMMIERLKDPLVRVKLREEMKNSDLDYGKMEVAISPLDRTLARRKIKDIADAQEKSIEDVIMDILIASDGRVIISFEVLSKDNIRKELRHLLSMVATNGSGYSIKHSTTGELVHPRSFGTFPKVLSRYVIEEGILTWEEAIRKMTGLPAEKFGLLGRGKLKEGNFADLLIINQDRIEGIANKGNPYQYSKGIETMIINGQMVIENGQHNGGRFGKILRK